MSIEALNWAFKQDLKPTHKFVLVALADCTDDYGICFPSHRHIISKTGFSKATVKSSISELNAKKIIERVERFRPNLSKTSNAYRLPIVDIIEDHPLSPLFKGGRSGDSLGVGQEIAEVGQEIAEGGSGDNPLEPSLNHHLTLKKKNPAGRDEFLRGLSKRFKDGDYDRFKASESWINTNGHDAWLHWEGHGFPKGDYYSAFHGWMRNAKAEHELNKHIRKNTTNNTGTPHTNPNDQWRLRVANFEKGLPWVTTWGEPPDNPATKVPKEILKEFSINQPKENYDA